MLNAVRLNKIDQALCVAISGKFPPSQKFYKQNLLIIILRTVSDPLSEGGGGEEGKRARLIDAYDPPAACDVYCVARCVRSATQPNIVCVAYPFVYA